MGRRGVRSPDWRYGGRSRGPGRSRTDLAYAFMLGAEAAWKCTRNRGAAIRRAPRLAGPEGWARSDRGEVGDQAFRDEWPPRVRRWTHDAKTLTVVVDEVPFQQINPCFQAVMWASRHLERTEIFVVRTPNAERNAMSLPRPPLDATFVVWREAIGRFSAMPLSTFLPAQTWSRLAVELPDAAALRAASHALNRTRSMFTTRLRGDPRSARAPNSCARPPT